MTFDQFANQGGTAAWDPDEAAATKKAADKLFAADLGTVGQEPLQAPEAENPDQPGEIEDPDIRIGS